jgi:hypothetical protein
MKSELLTVLGVILLGLNHGIMQAYLNTADKASGVSQEIINIAIPTILDTLCFFILIWGIAISKKSTSSKAILMFLLIALILTELYYIYAKPPLLILGQVLLHISTLFKLYVLITLHCDVSSGTSSDFVTQSYKFVEKQFSNFKKLFDKKDKKAEPKSEPKAELKAEPKVEPKAEADYIKATQIFNEALGKTDYTPEEKIELKEKFNAGIKEENPWNTMWNTFNNSVLNKIGEQMSKDDKDIQRNNFKLAMGKTPR